MTDERRYDDDEVAAIFEIATRTDGPARRRAIEAGDADRGLTLAEIQRIGAEVGVPPERIAAGARALHQGPAGAAVRRKILGFPIALGGAVELPRPLTDTEWERLVGEIRDHFNAHGKLDRSGSLRSWRNGNLRVELLPTDDGQGIRMRTYRQQSAAFVGMGAAFAGIGTLLAAMSIFTGGVDADLWVFAAISGGFVAAGLAPLRGWASRRLHQMEAIAASAARMAGRPRPGHEDPRAAPGEPLSPVSPDSTSA